MKVIIHKFKRIEGQTVNIPANITGGNGSGKTTILEAISFCLTGKDLSGNEFKQIYDNRADIHDAVADVSYFDNYGNEFRRTVAPVFQVNRQGVEEIKIKRDTVCQKNGIAVNDFAPEFSDFAKFGTDFFFKQKKDEQRKIFIDALKSKMPDYDIHANSLKLKELVKAQKIAQEEIKQLTNAQKQLQSVKVPEIPEELRKLNDKYLSLTAADNSAIIGEINARNNQMMRDFLSLKSSLSGQISDLENQITRANGKIDLFRSEIKSIEKSQPELNNEQDVSALHSEIKELENKLSALKHYATVEEYASENFSKNPVLVANAKKISAIQNKELTEEFSDACPLSGEPCETARLHSTGAAILRIKNENRAILSGEMAACNTQYTVTAQSLSDAKTKLSRFEIKNTEVRKKNELTLSTFDNEKSKKIGMLKTDISELEKQIVESAIKIEELKNNLSGLTEPTPEALPEEITIPDNLRVAHAEFIAIEKEITGAEAINTHNAAKRADNNAQIKIKQELLMELDTTIVRLRQEISDYFSNLNGIVKQEFAGDIEIGVELLEYVMSRDEYKDCFRITANGKVFPYECNGALQNNVKFQVLASLQRLNNYTGITIMDNCEANTTDPINTCGLPCVLATATNESELKIS